MPIDLIEEHLAHLAAAGRSAATIDDRRKLLHRLDGWLCEQQHDQPPDERGVQFASTTELRRFLAQYNNEQNSPWTPLTYHYHIHAFYLWGALEGVLDGDPSARLARPRTPRCVAHPVSDAELALALARSDRIWQERIILAAYAGFRAGEICRARYEDIDEDWVFVPYGKGGEPGVVPTHPLVWATFGHTRTGQIVTNTFGRKMTSKRLSADARTHFDRIGLPDVHLHRFRHWYGTTIQATHGDLRLTQECMRHANVTSTQIYTLVTPARRSAAVASLPVYSPAPAA